MPETEFGGPTPQDMGLNSKETSINKAEEEQVEEWRPYINERVFVKRTSGGIEGDWTVSQVKDNIAIVWKPNPDSPGNNIIKRIPVSELEGLNNKEVVNFSEAESFTDLYKLINYKGNIKGSTQEYTPQILEEIIEKVRKGDLELNFVTGTNGLRSAVEKLLLKEKKE